MIGSWNWYSVKDGDPMAVDLFRRHYSSLKKSPSIYRRYGFTGQGESLVLITNMGNALFVWVKQKIRDDSQTGLNCSVFRNESNILSSQLIIEAEQLALNKWPNETRFFTYVNPEKIIHKRDPGRCFIKAGYKKIGYSKNNKLILFEKVICQS